MDTFSFSREDSSLFPGPDQPSGSGLDGFQMLLVKRTKESEHKQEFEKKGILRRSMIGI
jgi:hypothetical protein